MSKYYPLCRCGHKGRWHYRYSWHSKETEYGLGWCHICNWLGQCGGFNPFDDVYEHLEWQVKKQNNLIYRLLLKMKILGL